MHLQLKVVTELQPGIFIFGLFDENSSMEMEKCKSARVKEAFSGICIIEASICDPGHYWTIILNTKKWFSFFFFPLFFSLPAGAQNS